MKTVNPHQDLLTLEPFRLKDLDGEEWRDIEGYNGYQISTFGRIKSFKRYHEGRILVPAIDKYGYLRIILCKNNRTKQNLIHRLVAEAFIPNPKNKPQVNHINGIKTDNRVENLEWCTGSENMRHAYATNLKTNARGENHVRAALTNEQAKWCRDVYVPNSVKFNCKALAGKLGTSEDVIRLIIHGETYKEAGGKFRKSRHHKVPEEIRAEIKRLYVPRSKEFSALALARKFGLSESTIMSIVSKR